MKPETMRTTTGMPYSGLPAVMQSLCSCWVVLQTPAYKYLYPGTQNMELLSCHVRIGTEVYYYYSTSGSARVDTKSSLCIYHIPVVVNLVRLPYQVRVLVPGRSGHAPLPGINCMWKL
jgi:hypothetical protein